MPALLDPLPPWSYVTTAQLCADVARFADAMPTDWDRVVAVARSGLVPGALLAYHWHRPLRTVSPGTGVTAPGSGWRLPAEDAAAPARRVLLIDDTVSTGRQMSVVAPLVRAEFPAAEVVRAAVYADPAGTPELDVWARESTPHFLEWNWANSGHAHHAAFDFDGVLCHDCPGADDDDGPRYAAFLRDARPLYLPRKTPVPLIVTGRHEKYRAQTLDWLARHGVKVHRLVMRDFPIDWRGDGLEQVARFKAAHFRVADLWMFIESDERQAGLIARETGLTVVCPGAARVWAPTARDWPPPARHWNERERGGDTRIPGGARRDPPRMERILAEIARRRARRGGMSQGAASDLTPT